MRVEVTTIEALPEGTPVPFHAGGRDIVLVRWRSAVYALRNRCPHMAKTFDCGGVGGRAGWRAGEPVYIDDDPVVTCPWHQFEFVLQSGRCLTDAALRVATYKVTVDEHGAIFVDFPPLPSDKRQGIPLSWTSVSTSSAPPAPEERNTNALAPSSTTS